MVRFHERGSLILGIIAIILALLSVKDYREIIINSDLIWIIVLMAFMVLGYMFLDKLIYQTSLFFGILEREIKAPSNDNTLLNPLTSPKLTTQDIQNFKRLYTWEYLIFSMVIMYTGVLLILLFLSRKSYIVIVPSLILMISMPLIGAYRFIGRARNGFSVRVEPEAYIEIHREAELKITMQNNYKKDYVTGVIKIVFPRDTEVEVSVNGKYSKIEGREFSTRFKLDGTKRKNSKNVRPIAFTLKYTGSKEYTDRIYIEIFASREYDGKLVPIEEYNPRFYVIPAYLVPFRDTNEEEDLENRPLDQDEYELEEVV